MAFNVSDPTQLGAMGKTLDEAFKQGEYHAARECAVDRRR